MYLGKNSWHRRDSILTLINFRPFFPSKGETKESIEFSKQFLERRSKLKNQQRAQNAHIDDMCSPAPALTPNDFQEVKVKKKKISRNQ